MRYVYGVLAAGCLAMAFYGAYQDMAVIAVMGWVLASVGWAAATAFLAHSERVYKKWEETIEKWASYT